MKKIGIIGGMGPVATSDLYDRILDICQSERGAIQDSEYPEIFIDSVSFKGSDETGIVDEDQVLNQFRNTSEKLEQCGVDLVLVPCNTLHSTIEALDEETDSKVFDMVELTASRVEESHIGLLGSETTYEEEIYEERMPRKEIIIPESENRKRISKVIQNVMGGRLLEEDKRSLLEIAEDLESKGAEALILGCTELPLVVSSSDFSLKTYDATQILAEEAVKETYSD